MENSTVNIFGYTFEHIAVATPFGNPVTAYRVTTESGYVIHTPKMEENVYKTSTFLYATDDLSAVEILPVSELPEGAEILGGNTEPETEIM